MRYKAKGLVVPSLVVCMLRSMVLEHMQLEARQSSTHSYSMDAREEGIIALLRGAIVQGALFGAGAQQPLERYLRRIRDLDPANMTSTTDDGTVVQNTFFDICCKVRSRAPCSPCDPPKDLVKSAHA